MRVQALAGMVRAKAMKAMVNSLLVGLVVSNVAYRYIITDILEKLTRFFSKSAYAAHVSKQYLLANKQ